MNHGYGGQQTTLAAFFIHLLFFKSEMILKLQSPFQEKAFQKHKIVGD